MKDFRCTHYSNNQFLSSSLWCVFAGSDAGGSIRNPAAWCGCVGLLPTQGRVSEVNAVSYAPSLSQLGPITGIGYKKTIRTLAKLFCIISLPFSICRSCEYTFVPSFAMQEV